MKGYVNVTKFTVKKGSGKTYTYYRANLILPRDPETGAQPKPRSFCASTAREAHQKREEHRRRHFADRAQDAAGFRDPRTLESFVQDHFLKFEEMRYEKGQLSATRLQARRSRFKRFLLERETAPAIRLRLATLGTLTIASVEDFFYDLYMDPVVTPETYNLLRQDFILAFKLARRRLPERCLEYCAEVPAQRVVRKTKLLFDSEQIEKAIRNEKYPLESRVPVAFEYIMNPRPSEMFALRWADIDFKNNTVRLDDAVVRGLTGYHVRAHTKNFERSDRTVPMPPELTHLFDRLKKQRLAKGMKSEFIFCKAQGGHHNKDSFRQRAWPRIKADLGLPDGPTFYSLKTLGNSRHRSSGVSGQVQMVKMGHTTPRMSDSAYRRIQPSEMEDAMELSRAMLRPAKSKRRTASRKKRASGNSK